MSALHWQFLRFLADRWEFERAFAAGYHAAAVPPGVPLADDCAACGLARSLGGDACALHKPKVSARGHTEDCECLRCGGEIGRKE